MMPTFDMQDFLGLDDRDFKLLRIKWALINGIALMLEDANVDAAALAAAADMDERHVELLLRGIVIDDSMETLALLYDAAAGLAVQPMLEMLISAPQTDE